MKKILKIILIILVVIFLIFLIDLFRKVNIINNYNAKLEKDLKITNFYIKNIDTSQNTYSEMWQKGSDFIYKDTSQDGIRMVCNIDGKGYIITDTIIDAEISKNVAIFKIEENSTFPGLGVSSISGPYNSFWDNLKLAATCNIKTSTVNNEDCYNIYLADNFQVYISKKTYRKVKEINGAINSIYEYSIGTVTDSDITLPSFDGFQVNET